MHPSHLLPVLHVMLLGQVLPQEDIGLPAGSDVVLSSSYVDSFSCEDQAYGYYADVDNNCEVRLSTHPSLVLERQFLPQVFHICYPIADETGTITEYKR